MSVNWLLNKSVISLTAIVLVFSFCRKERLNKEKEILVGEWEWVYSVQKKNGGGLSGSSFSILTPDTEGATYSMTFLKKGKVIFYKNGEEEERKRLGIAKSKGIYFISDSLLKYSYRLNNDQKVSFDGWLKLSQDNSTVDTLKTKWYFPFNDFYFAGKSFTNYFIRK